MRRACASWALTAVALLFSTGCDSKADRDDSSSPTVYTSVRVTRDFSCALEAGGIAVCWGDLSDWAAPLPAEPVRDLSCGYFHCCALSVQRDDPVCWGIDIYGEVLDVSYSRQYRVLSAGQFQTCALRADGHTRCWGYTVDSPEPDAPDDLVSLVSGGPAACGIRLSGYAACWGDSFYRVSEVPDVPLVQLDMIAHSVAALDAQGVPYFWGGDWQRDSNVPQDQLFSKLSIGPDIGSDDEAGCGITLEGALLCWGNGPDGRQSPPSFSQPVLDVDLGQHHGCALLVDGSVSCWGADPDGLGLLEGPP